MSMAFPQQIEFLGAVFVVHKLFIIGMALVLLGALSAFLNRTKAGLAVVATAQDADAAALQGMNPDSAARLTMGISTALAGMAGAIIAPTTIVSPHMGVTVILPAFVVVIVGGAGSVRGALVASLIFGMLQGGSDYTTEPHRCHCHWARRDAHHIVLPTGRDIRGMKWTGQMLWSLKGLIVVFVLIALFVPRMSGYELQLITDLMITMIIVSSFRFITLTGRWCFAHIALAGVGGYTSAIFVIDYDVPFAASLFLGGILAAIVALVISFPTLRTSDFYFLMSTFAAAGLIVWTWNRLIHPFGGTSGIYGIPRPRLSVALILVVRSATRISWP